MDFPEGDGTEEKEAKRGQSRGGLQITQKYGTEGPTNIQGGWRSKSVADMVELPCFLTPFVPY